MLNKLMLVGISFIFLLTTACGQYASKSQNGITLEQGNVSSPEIQKIVSEIEMVELESLKIESEIQRLSQLAPHKIKVNDLKDLVKNFKSYIDTALKMIQDLRAQIQAQLIQLDPNNPAHQQLIDQLQRALVFLDELEQQLRSLTDIVKDLVDQLFQKIEDKIDQTSSGVTKILLRLVLEALKNEVIKNLPSI